MVGYTQLFQEMESLFNQTTIHDFQMLVEDHDPQEVSKIPFSKFTNYTLYRTLDGPVRAAAGTAEPLRRLPVRKEGLRHRQGNPVKVMILH